MVKNIPGILEALGSISFNFPVEQISSLLFSLSASILFFLLQYKLIQGFSESLSAEGRRRRKKKEKGGRRRRKKEEEEGGA